MKAEIKNDKLLLYCETKKEEKRLINYLTENGCKIIIPKRIDRLAYCVMNDVKIVIP